MAWLRLQSQSIWPVAIMHATHNGVIQTFFDRLTIQSDTTQYLTGEFGIALVPVTLIIAFYFWKKPVLIEKK